MIDTTSTSLPNAQPANVGLPGGASTLRVSLQRSDVALSDEAALWPIIRASSEAISFKKYKHFIDEEVCNWSDEVRRERLNDRVRLPFTRVDAYRMLQAATDMFLMTNVGVAMKTDERGRFVDTSWFNPAAERSRLGESFSVADLEQRWTNYLRSGDPRLLPYMDLVKQNWGMDLGKTRDALCTAMMQSKLTQPALLELIWSYWQEEGMLAQGLTAIAMRFQNRRVGGLANMEIDTLRPLNHLLWGYTQDEQHRLTVQRRAYEYDHAYGITLSGKAVGEIDGASSRSRFLEAFHRLLNLCSRFFQQDDDTTVRADGFPVLNALRETALILGEGAQNQYGDLPWVARGEMLMQQYLLSRPEMRDFLQSRPMVPYPEPWMERLESLKHIMGWTSTSVLHFNNLGVYGERLLLSARFHPWTQTDDPNVAAGWARYWRAEIQGYIHSYSAATGVDLSAAAVADRIDATPPSVLLAQRAANR